MRACCVLHMISSKTVLSDSYEQKEHAEFMAE